MYDDMYIKGVVAFVRQAIVAAMTVTSAIHFINFLGEDIKPYWAAMQNINRDALYS